MKMRQRYIPIIAVLVLFSACAQLQPGSDAVVVRAEQATQLAYNTFESFKQYEYNNRATLATLNPQIEHYANVVRRNEKQWLQSARAATMTYKSNRTPENKANLDTALAVLQEAVNQISQYTAQSKVQ